MSHLAAKQALSANDRLRIAVLGVNGRGQDHIKGLMVQSDAEVVMLCDPDLEVAGKRAAEFQEKYGKKVAVEQDLRKVFDNKDIDAVTIATPNHWHSLATIWACQAGKDVYVEKPGATTSTKAARWSRRPTSTTASSSTACNSAARRRIREAVDCCARGTIGNVYMARGLVFRWRPSIGHKGVEAVPAALNYDIWTGPAADAAILAAHRPLQLALELDVRQRRRRQPGDPRDRPVHVGTRGGDASEEGHLDGGQVPVRRRQGDAGGPDQHLSVPRPEEDDPVRGAALVHQPRRRRWRRQHLLRLRRLHGHQGL